ncbi:MAG: translation initiation factor [Ferruginibacter sp.]
MPKSNKSYTGIVYSTDPEFRMAENDREEQQTLPPADQLLRVRLETKHRAGKAVTILDNFIGSDTDKEDIGKKLKAFCGTGGSVKDGEILVQGDNREKILQWLLKNGFKQSKKTG